ncbi:MAG: hypothetical protein ACK401_07050 [Archaeoglobaceae archaeon]
MFEVPYELIFGIVVVVAVLILNFAPGGKIKVNLKAPSFNFSRKKVAKKLEEIDKQLEEVVSATTLPNEKIVKLEDATKEVTKKFEVEGDLLSEMQTTNKISEKKEEKSENLPEFSLPSVDIGDLEKSAIENEVKLEEDNMSALEAEKNEKIEFEESDALLEDIAKEVEKKEEETVDFLRELKGQKFNAKELERELTEILSIAKRLAK